VQVAGETSQSLRSFEVTGLWEKGGGRKWALRAHFLPPQINPGALSFRLKNAAQQVLKGEIYSLMSSPHYAQKFWVNSTNEKAERVG